MPACECANLDWTGCDQTAEHHPDCKVNDSASESLDDREPPSKAIMDRMIANFKKHYMWNYNPVTGEAYTEEEHCLANVQAREAKEEPTATDLTIAAEEAKAAITKSEQLSHDKWQGSVDLMHTDARGFYNPCKVDDGYRADMFPVALIFAETQPDGTRQAITVYRELDGDRLELLKKLFRNPSS